MPHDDDALAGFVERLRAGDPAAFAALFTHYGDRLGRLVDFRLDDRLRGRVSASDVLQQSYLDGLRRLDHFRADPDVPFFVWLRAITLQSLVDAHRRHLGARGRDAGRDRPLDAFGAASSERLAVLMGDLTSPSQALGRSETIAIVRRALDDLEPIDREILALRHFEELSNREVAAVLGIGTAAASKRYVRALERLREAIEPGLGPEATRDGSP